MVILTCIVIALLVLAALLIQTFVKGVGYLTPDFTNFFFYTSQAGIKGALAGTIWLMISIIPISIVLV